MSSSKTTKQHDLNLNLPGSSQGSHLLRSTTATAFEVKPESETLWAK